MPRKSGFTSSVSHSAFTTAYLLPIAAGAALFISSPSAAQSVCDIVPGVNVNCTGGTGGVVDVDGGTDPVTVTLNDGFKSLDTINILTTDGDININSLGSAVIDTADGPGVVATTTDNIEGNVTLIDTVAPGGTGALLNAGGDVIFTLDNAVRTVGDAADGINTSGASVALDLGDITTQGAEADGVEVVSTDGPITINADTIETNGGLSDATILRGTGDIDLTAHALRTNGTDAIAADISTDPAACVMAGNNGCDVTAAVDEITTNGFGGIGALVAGSGNTAVNVGVLRTGGDQAAGLDLAADPAACVTLGVGQCSTAFTVDQLATEGFNSPGAIVRAVGPTDATVNVLQTGGDQAAGLDLASNPTACALLGPGQCDTNFSVGQLTTGGDNAPGVLVRAAGATTGTVDVLRTGGDQAAGLDIASDPTACVILGAGACGTSFSVGSLTTNGDGSTGALIRAVGPTNGNVGLLSTSGDDAAGVDIAGDPTACVLLGAGACDVGFVAQEVSTQGDGSVGVLIDTVGDVTTDIGALSTNGDDSTGLGIFTDPTACLAIGPGSCRIMAQADDVDTRGDNSPGVVVDGGEDPVDVDVGTVDTDGDNSPGVDAKGTGPVTVVADTVETGGDNSPGITADGDDDPVSVTFNDIITAGDDSPGVAVSGEGIISVDGGNVTTAGGNSDGIIVDGGAGLVTVDADAITTAGPDSDGINVATKTGAQIIRAGPLRTAGLRSNGIVANASGCGDVAIIARDDVISTQATAILASSACEVSVTTLPGAAVSGATAGIAATSGTGTRIAIGDTLTATAGPAIDADGAAAAVTIASTGTVTGAVDLTDNDDTLDNAGTFAPAVGTDFGAGVDVLANRGMLRVGQSVTLAGLETLDNSGTIDLADGVADDVLTLPGAFNGGAGSTLSVDLAQGTTGTPTDRLVVGGAVSGSTAVRLNLVGAGPAVINAAGALVVDSASAPANAYTLAEPVSAGFVDYSLGQNETGDLLVFALPNALAFEPLLLPGIGQALWYQSADSWSDQIALRRHQIGTGRIWGQVYAGSDKRGDRDRDVDIFGSPTSINLRYKTDRFGIQAGADFGNGPTLFGVTGGWEKAKVDFASPTDADLHGFNVGAYLLHTTAGGFYFELLGKADFYKADLSNGALFTGGKVDGRSYGAEGELGYRFGTASLNFDLNAGLAYVRTDIDSIGAAGGSFDYDNADSLRGRAGVRVSGNSTGLAPFGEVRVMHEFAGDNDARFASGGFALPFSDSIGTSVRGELGIAGLTGTTALDLSAWGEAGDVRGYGLRLGIRF